MSPIKIHKLNKFKKKEEGEIDVIMHNKRSRTNTHEVSQEIMTLTKKCYSYMPHLPAQKEKQS